MKTRLFAMAASSALVVLLVGCGAPHASSPTSAVSPATASPAVRSVANVSDSDVSFAQQMIPHHQQAVEMADLALTRETSPEVKKLAEQIKAAQGPEIEMMSMWLQSWGAPMEMGEDHSGHDMGGMDMSGMMSDDDMQALADALGAEFDRMWLEMMIAHHQGAISMAEQVKAASSNADVTSLAGAVMTGQAEEIDTMQKLLAQ
jgi:uncharacterized protein (DUF305 family)